MCRLSHAFERHTHIAVVSLTDRIHGVVLHTRGNHRPAPESEVCQQFMSVARSNQKVNSLAPRVEWLEASGGQMLRRYNAKDSATYTQGYSIFRVVSDVNIYDVGSCWLKAIVNYGVMCLRVNIYSVNGWIGHRLKCSWTCHWLRTIPSVIMFYILWRVVLWLAFYFNIQDDFYHSLSYYVLRDSIYSLI